MNALKKKPKPLYRALNNTLEAAMVLLAILFIYPALFVLLNAFKPDAQILMNPLSLPKSLFFGNFVIAWKTINIPLTFGRTLFITSGSVSGIILVSSMAAYMLARTESRLSRYLYLFFAFALVIPFQVIMVPIAVLASDLGLTNIWGIVVMYWGLGCPMAVFMYHGFVKGVPRELEESAAMDGAGQFYIFFNIVLPLLKPITATIAVLDALWVWNDYLLPLLVVRNGTIQLEQMVFNGQFVKQYGPISASLILSALPIVLFYLILQKYIIKGIAAGAVKG
jgi:raffinose/stachyose/melibiose transport system permease protein